jgi:hypothetical protein
MLQDSAAATSINAPVLDFKQNFHRQRLHSFPTVPKPAMVVPTPPPYSGMHLGGSLSSSGDDNEAILGSPEVNLLAPLPSLQTDP